jgi:mRNA interferase MazF
MKMSGKKLPRRGEVYWVSLDPTVGAETKKKRPCLIVSNDIINEMSDVIIVAPITSQVKKVYSCEVKSPIAKKLGKIMLHQCRAIDKSRVEEKLDYLDFDVMKLVDEAIKVAFGLS